MHPVASVHFPKAVDTTSRQEYAIRSALTLVLGAYQELMDGAVEEGHDLQFVAVVDGDDYPERGQEMRPVCLNETKDAPNLSFTMLPFPYGLSSCAGRRGCGCGGRR